MSQGASPPLKRAQSTFQRYWLTGLCPLWIGFIFGTSCTVVRPQEFFEWIHTNLFVDESLFAKFQTFWGVCWFAVVKSWHALEFAILLWLTVTLLTWWTGSRTQRTVIRAMIFCTVFAISDEWHQTFVPDRMGTVSDVLIDGIGILFAGLALLRGTRSANFQECCNDT